MYKETIPTLSDETAAELDKWRIWLLDALLVSALVSGLFAVMPTLQRATFDPAERPVLVAYGAAYLLATGMLLARRLDLRWRTLGFLAATCAVSVIDMARGGLAGSGRVYLMVNVVLTIALLGWPAGIAAGLAGLAIYAGTGIAIGQAWLTPMSVTNDWWVSEGLGFVMAITLLLVVQVGFVEAHRRALERAQDTQIKLAAAHAYQLHLARVLHDETVQQMYGVLLSLRRAIADVQRYPERSVARLTHALDLSTQAWQGLRDHLQALRQPSPAPKTSSLPASISNDLKTDLPGELVPFDIQMLLTRMVQEGLSNVYRHSRATQARVEMRLEDERIRINVEDNGTGFDPAQTPAPSFGLASLREQIVALGGTLTIDSAPDAGTRLSASIPSGARP